MSKPIFCVTHPRACSTAFERVFMTRTEDLTCFHEPFSNAFYFGPERMSSRYEGREARREESGFVDYTYKVVLDQIEREQEEVISNAIPAIQKDAFPAHNLGFTPARSESITFQQGKVTHNIQGKRPFFKDMAYYFVPPAAKPPQIAPSLLSKKRGIGTSDNKVTVNGTSGGSPFPYGTESERGNPTIVPEAILKKFHLTFLIRDPHSSIPSFYRCTVGHMQEITKDYEFDPVEAGYKELRQFLDYVVSIGLVGPKQIANGQGLNGHAVNGNHVAESGANEMCLIDADDLLDNPAGILRIYCHNVGLEYDESMLRWDDEESATTAKNAFEKWKGWHDDALDSSGLKPRAHKKKQKTEEEWDAEWKDKYGEDGARIIRATVDENMADYLYLKQFAVKV